ncbi:DDE superfamily endonuclease [Rathayibacter tanaceti]|uniref:DDE Tnp4 domain-containing protein n=2 Tax=Rathayibacter tanaceti TaxID=1671680 RepID=A0A162FZB1_9MICO|nr:hypothetical protein ACH61_01094 [Rathayibacter tanaceti]QHC54502.1 hypothetical protein GSU10_01720 [Rathayibacter tanaceti]TCO35002.1 DDE superfamily endonuclease [Rathayibacter tanaceti]
MLNVVTDDEQADVAAALGGTAAVIDGTLLPCWSWADAPELYSGKHKTTGHNCQVLADLSGRLLSLSAPISGKHHDTHALRETGLATIIDFFNTLADRRYQGTGLVTPITRRSRQEHLPDYAKRHNMFVNTHRYVTERNNRRYQDLAHPPHRLKAPATHIPERILSHPPTHLLHPEQHEFRISLSGGRMPSLR